MLTTRLLSHPIREATCSEMKLILIAEGFTSSPDGCRDRARQTESVGVLSADQEHVRRVGLQATDGVR